MMNKDLDKEDLEEYLEARESQLNNVLSSPIGTGDYSMPSAEEVNETIFLEDKIELLLSDKNWKRHKRIAQSQI